MCELCLLCLPGPVSAPFPFPKRPFPQPTNSSVLEGADPAAYLREALEATFAKAVGMWARHTVRPLGE